jgi:hypothetical protein
MSQDANTRQVFLNASQDGSVQSWGATLASVAGNPEGFSVESYADRLMDDLFEDVERMLDGGGRRATKKSVSPDPDQPEPKKVVAEDSAPSALPLVVRSQPDSHQEIVSAKPDPFPTDIAPISAASAPFKMPQQPGRSYDRLLLMVGCISVVVTLAIWLVIQETQQQPVPVATSVQEPASPEAQGDRQFAEYVQQALQAIDQRTPASPTSGLPVASVSPGITLPTIPGPVAPTSNNSQRIYVPIYQLPPNLSSSKATYSQKTPAVAPLPTLPTFPQAANPAKPGPSLATTGVVRTLVGVLELGDRSAALIEINGVAQRFRVGEGIGTTGWMLVEVSKNQAIIRRNGKVRSVFIGQSF